MKWRVIAALGAVGLFVTLAWSGAAAAELGKPDKEGWIALFNGKDLTGWHARDKRHKNNWVVEPGGILHNKATGSDLISDVKLMDHELHIEFKVPKRGNSGVYLQGRYEVQVADSYGRRPGRHMCGAIYGKIAPKVNASKPAGEWQTYDIKFYSARRGPDGKIIKKARITVVHNGKLIIDNAEIDGLTGGAVDRKEGTPAGLMLQGDHTEVWYRNIKYRPIK